MDRLWSSVAARSTKSDSSRATNPVEIAMETKESEPQGIPPFAGLSLGMLVPTFTSNSTQGKIDWHRWIGDSWALLISYPHDFNPVSTTELAELAKMRKDFEERGVKVAVLSANSVDDHHEWVHDIESSELPDGHPIFFPLISDPERSVSEMYGMLDPNVKTLPQHGLPIVCRCALLIGPDRRLRCSMMYPPSTGRNMSEILRAIDSIQLNEKHHVMTPANWVPGESCTIDPSLSDHEAKARFEKVTTVSMNSGRTYMRFVSDPSGPKKSTFSWGGFFKTLLSVTSGLVIGAVGSKYIKGKSNQA